MTANKKIVQARAPLRIGLAGGGTDVAPYCDDYGGAVLSLSIKRYCYARVELIEQPIIECISFDLDVKESFRIEEITNGCPVKQYKTALIIGSIQYFLQIFKIKIAGGFKVSTFADAPKGSGLGTSSTLVVSVLSAMCEICSVRLDEYELAHHAFEAERVHLGFGGGYQDQFAAVFGGVNLIRKNNSQFLVEQIKLRDPITKALEMSLKLYFTGVSRSSEEIISSQIKATKSAARLAAMHNLKREAEEMKRSLLMADIHGVIESLRFGWEAKKKTSNKMIPPFLETTFSGFIKHGAEAGKISGAGGGGFMLLFVPIAHLSSVRSFAGKHGHLDDVNIEYNGVETW